VANNVSNINVSVENTMSELVLMEFFLQDDIKNMTIQTRLNKPFIQIFLFLEMYCNTITKIDLFMN